MMTEVHIEALEQVLRELLVEHESLVDLASRHREALRAADGPTVTAVSPASRSTRCEPMNPAPPVMTTRWAMGGS